MHQPISTDSRCTGTSMYFGKDIVQKNIIKIILKVSLIYIIHQRALKFIFLLNTYPG